MTKEKNLFLWLEIVWWVITAVVVYAVLFPIHKAMYSWPFERTNIIFIVVLITLARYIFLLKFTFLGTQQILKIVLLIAMLPLTTFLIRELNLFMVFIEENTWQPLTGHLPLAEKASMDKYIWNEMVFFGVGSIISAPIFAVRMMASIWLYRNRGRI